MLAEAITWWRWNATPAGRAAASLLSGLDLSTPPDQALEEQNGDAPQWLSTAEHRPMAAWRTGGACRPRAVVWGCTGMHPGAWDGLLRALERPRRTGDRPAGAHFLIHRDGGIVQLAPLGVDASHAGGGRAGSIGAQHPNVCSVGVLLHSPGRVRRTRGAWHLPGRPLVEVDPWGVVPDPDPDWGWYRYSRDQEKAAVRLVFALATVLPWISREHQQVPVAKHHPRYNRWHRSTAIRPVLLVTHDDLQTDSPLNPGPTFGAVAAAIAEEL